MPLKPTRYEYEEPTRIHGDSPKVSTKMDISMSGPTWVGTIHMISTPVGSHEEAERNLRDELLRIAAILAGTGGGK